MALSFAAVFIYAGTMSTSGIVAARSSSVSVVCVLLVSVCGVCACAFPEKISALASAAAVAEVRIRTCDESDRIMLLAALLRARRFDFRDCCMRNTVAFRKTLCSRCLAIF